MSLRFISILLLFQGIFFSVTAPGAVATTLPSIGPHTWTNSSLRVPALLASNIQQLNHQPDNETLAAFKKAGVCMAYLGRLLNDYNEDWNRDKELMSCETYCDAQPAHDGYGCLGPVNVTELSQLDPSTIFVDDDGLHYTPGTCDCDFEIAEVIIGIIAEGLEHLDAVLCSVFTSIFEDVLLVGTMFLPGADIYDAVEDIITTVKTFDQNALSPMDYFTNYLGSKCGIQGMTLDPFALFAILAGASNSLGTSSGCKRKNPSGCVKPKDNPDPAPDVPRPPAKDPWEDETPPTSDIPTYCDNSEASFFGLSTPLAKRRGGSKCKAIPDVASKGYNIEDKSASGQYMPGTWSVQSPDKWSKGQLNDVAILRLDTDYNAVTVEYAYLDMIDTIKKLSLRDMIAGIWKAKSGKGVEEINQIIHQSVVEKGWTGRDASDTGTRGKVLGLLGQQIGDEYSVSVWDTGNAKQAFDIMLKETSQGAGVFKMLQDYAGGAGRQVTQIDVHRVGGQDCMYFFINAGSTA